MCSFQLFRSRLMMSFEVLKSKGLKKVSYAPPVFWLYWLLRLRIRPPHFSGFLFNFIHLTIFYAVVWGVSMQIISDIFDVHVTTDPLMQAKLSIAGGIIFGLAGAVCYQISGKLNALPEWHEIVVKADLDCDCIVGH